MSKGAEMIYFYYGENDLGIKRQVAAVTKKFAAKYRAENIARLDGSNIDAQKLVVEIVNMNLFAPNRLIVLTDTSKNKPAWTALGENLTRVPAETELVIVEPSPDKRTKTFKQLSKLARTRQFASLKNQDLVDFVLREAADSRVEIKRPAADELIIYTGGDPWRIASEISKFRALDRVVTVEAVRATVEPVLEASAFKLLDDLMSGRRDAALAELSQLRRSEDANRFFGLLSSQILALAVAVNSGGKNSAEIARETGIHSFVISKMLTAARRLSPRDVRKMSLILAETDAKLTTTSGADPWVLIEVAISKF
jgi:DNA polymerase-3 subunit delta